MILFEGPSLIDGTPIVCVATEDENPKTGRMLMTWILRQDRPPEVAAYDGSDDAICGDCKFRAQLEPPLIGEELTLNPTTRTCYVRLGADADEAVPPSEVWRRWKAGDLGGNEWAAQWRCSDCFYYWNYIGPLPVRIASYGDAAAVPTRVWAELVRHKPRQFVGFTHLWKSMKCWNCSGKGKFKAYIRHHPENWAGEKNYEMETCKWCKGTGKGCDPELKRYCMASVDTPEERDEAQALGWRTFLVVPEEKALRVRNYTLMKDVNCDDILCPATDPHPKRDTTCATCLMCAGTSARMSKSIWEKIHGKNAANHTW